MPGEPLPIAIPASILSSVFEQARQAFPKECCGWLTGEKGGSSVHTMRPCTNQQSKGTHPTQVARSAETAYVIDGPDLLAFNRSIDSSSPAKIIYHSHNNGRAYFSATDVEVASSPWGDGPMYPVQQLVVGLSDSEVCEAALFAWSDDARTFVEVARFEGARI